MLIPKVKHALRKICSIVLSKPIDNTTLDDIEQVKSIFQSFIDSGSSPKQIQEIYNLKYTDFGMFMKRCLGMTIKTHRAALQNFHIKNGTLLSDVKLRYKTDAAFKFSLHNLPFIPGIDKLTELGMFHPTKNPSGLVKDHMVSLEYGYQNNINPDIIAHSANCRLITNMENITKGSDCSISLEQLMERILDINVMPESIKIVVPRTEIHKQRISESNIKWRRVTNGKENLRILKSLPIPEGYRSGFTRKNKMVP